MDTAEVTWLAYDITFIQNTMGGGGGAEVTRPAGNFFSTKDHMLCGSSEHSPTHRAFRRHRFPCQSQNRRSEGNRF